MLHLEKLLRSNSFYYIKDGFNGINITMRAHEFIIEKIEVEEDIDLDQFRSQAVKDGRMGSKTKPIGQGYTPEKRRKVSRPEAPKMDRRYKANTNGPQS